MGEFSGDDPPMSLRIRCSCGNKLEVRDPIPGSTVPCPLCGLEVPVPGSVPSGSDGRTRVHGPGEDFSLDAPESTGHTRLAGPPTTPDTVVLPPAAPAPPPASPPIPAASTASPATAGANNRSSLLPIGIAGGVVLLAVAGWFLFGPGKERPQESVDLGPGKEKQAPTGLPPLTPMPPYQGPRPWVSSVAFSPDGKLAALGGGYRSGGDVPDYAVGIWEVETGRELRRMTGSTGMVSHVAISADNRFVLGVHGRGGCTVWEVETAQQIRQYPRVLGAAFAEGGKVLLADSTSISLRQLSADEPIWRYQPTTRARPQGGPPAPVSRQAELVVSNQEEFGRVVLDLATGGERRALVGQAFPTGFTISSDGKEVLVVNGFGPQSDAEIVRVRSIRTGAELSQRKARRIRGLAITGDGSRAACTDEKDFILFDTRSGQTLRTFPGHDDAVFGLAFSPNDRWILSGAFDGTMRLWDVETGAAIRTFGGK